MPPPHARRPLLAPSFWVAFLALGLAFVLFPQLDLAFSGLFYRPPEGFFLKNLWPLRFVHALVEWLSWIVPGALIALIAASALGAGRALARWRKPALYLLVVLALGPGLLVNGWLKEHVERARPSDVTEFGGARVFTPPFLPTAECRTNCSFVSGHAAMGFYAVSLAFIVPAARRRRYLVLGTATGAVVGLMRVVQGAHFLSDVVFAFFVVYFAAALARRLLYRPEPALAVQASSRSEVGSP